MTLDQDTIVVRLGVMNDLLGDLESLGAVDAALLRSDRMARHAVERILTQLVEFAVSINSHVTAAVSGSVPGTYRESFYTATDAGFIPADLAERLAPSAGLRNVLTHEYVEVDRDLVAAAVGTAMVDYRDYVRAVAQALQDR
jgi:uncharacterized protein YutE (UPF0331/DUF86 family)